MLVLALDTALQRCSVAIVRDGAPVAECIEDLARGHAERLVPMVAETLTKAGVAVSEIDRVGVVVGPGGFTGVRVGLAFARALAVGTKIEIVGVTSLAALAANVDADAEKIMVAAIIDARRGEVYAALFDPNGEPIVPPFAAPPSAAIDLLAASAGAFEVICVGSGASLPPNLPAGWRIAGAPDQIDPKTVARLCTIADAPVGPPGPIYLRPPDAKPQKPSALKMSPT